MDFKEIPFDMQGEKEVSLGLNLPPSSLLFAIWIEGLEELSDLKQASFVAGCTVLDVVQPLVMDQEADPHRALLPFGLSNGAYIQSPYIKTEILLEGTREVASCALGYSWFTPVPRSDPPTLPRPITNHSYADYSLETSSSIFNFVPLYYTTSTIFLRCPPLKHFGLYIRREGTGETVFDFEKDNLDEGVHTFYASEFASVFSGFVNLAPFQVDLLCTLKDGEKPGPDKILSLGSLNHNRLVFDIYGGPSLEFSS